MVEIFHPKLITDKVDILDLSKEKILRDRQPICFVATPRKFEKKI